MIKRLLFAAIPLILTLGANAKDADTLKTVVVTGSRYEVEERQQPNTVSSIDRSTLTQGHQLSMMPALMQHVPGLLITSRGMLGYGLSTGGSGNMVLRGVTSGSGGVMVLIDGNPQYSGIYGHSIADGYLNMIAEKVEVLRGPASALYGSNAMGGVVNIITRQHNEDGIHTDISLGGGSYGTWQAEATNQVKKGKFTLHTAAQYSHSDNHRPNMAFTQYGGFIKAGYHLNQAWNLSANISLTHFNASNPGTVAAPKLDNDQWITRANAALTLSNNYDWTYGALNVYDNFGRHKIDDGHEASSPAQTDFFRSKDALAGVAWHQSFRCFKGNQLTVGIDYQHIYGRAWYTDKQTGETVLTPKRKMQSTHTHENEWAGYLDFRQEITRLLTLDAAIRYDHHSVAGGEWVPQVGIVVRPIATGEIKAMVSRGFRNPTTKEMYLYGTANHDSLHAESMMNYELSWRQRLLENRLHYGLTLFLTKGDNMIQTIAGKNVNSGTFSNKGVEMDLDWHINSHWALHTNHSYLSMKNVLAGAPRYKGFLGANFRSGKWQAEAGVQQLSGLCLKNGDADHLEHATLLHASVDYSPVPYLQLWLRGENLLAQRYQINDGYPMPRATFMAGVKFSF